ncbi:MAG: hypothetical protein PUK16_08575 [Prevotellaceae bacterium]|nr:hypothetical protein [Prevotellaceae bacterium]
MSKSTHFFGQPVYGQLIKSLDHDKIVEMSRKVNDRKCMNKRSLMTDLV